MNGIKITKNVDINQANDTDFVMDTGFLGGMKTSEIKKFLPSVDGQTSPTSDFITITYAHGLNFIPATLCFQGGVQGVGWQNGAVIQQPSINADNKNIYIVCGVPALPTPDTEIYAVIFAEKVAD